MNRITQDMKYRQSIMKYGQSGMKYAQKFGVQRASCKYNKCRSYIYFWLSCYDGSIESLACRSRRPHSHPNQHTERQLKWNRDLRRETPSLGMIEFWHGLRCTKGYHRSPEGLFHVMHKQRHTADAKGEAHIHPQTLRTDVPAW